MFPFTSDCRRLHARKIGLCYNRQRRIYCLSYAHFVHAVVSRGLREDPSLPSKQREDNKQTTYCGSVRWGLPLKLIKADI